jgi:hypothetical protein
MCGRLRLPARHIGMLCSEAAVGLFSPAITSEAAALRLGSVPEPGGHHLTEVAWLTRQCPL